MDHEPASKIHNDEEDLDKIARKMCDLYTTSSSTSVAPLSEDFLESLDKIEKLSHKVIPKDQEDSDSDSGLDVTTNEFLNLHEELESDSDSNDTSDESFLISKKMQTYFEKYHALNDQITKTVEELSLLGVRRTRVCEKTDLLDHTSRQLVAAQTELTNRNEILARDLSYFLTARLVSQRIASTQYFVATKQLFEILDKIDDGIAYLSSHPSYRESDYYLSQYKMSLNVVLSLMKTHISSVLEQLTSETYQGSAPQESDRPAELDPAISFYYGKFQALSYKIQPLIRQLETRSKTTKEYEHLLEEIQQIYVEKRYELMNESVANSIRAVTEKHRNDRSLLFRSSCSLFTLLCQDEHQLYYVFFSNSSPKLQKYLEDICSHLYDALRPFIIQMEHIEILCELCTILKNDVLQNVDYDREALDAFGNVVMELLRDIQERLVFRSHIYFRQDILGFTPSAGDLAYPDKLQMMMSIVQSTNLENRDLTASRRLRRADSQLSVSSNSSQAKPMTITDLQGMWYPTIRRTLQTLSRLYRCVDLPIFQGLSQEAIQFCVMSINQAGDAITQRSSPLDGDLFQIKHLLILREQIAAFQVDFTARETTLDFTKVREAAVELMQRKNLFKMDSNNAILKFLIEGAPMVREHVLDSKKDADLQLKRTCQHLIAHITHLLIEPLQNLNQKIQDYRKSGEFNVQNFRKNQWTQPEALAEIVMDVKKNIKTKITPIQQSLTLYIHNRETESILFRPVKNNIIGAFVQLEQLLSECYYEWSELLTISCPTADQVSLMLSSATLVNAQSVQELENPEPNK